MTTLKDNLNYLTGVKSDNPEEAAIALDNHIIRRADESSSSMLAEIKMMNVHLDSLRKATESLQVSNASLQSSKLSPWHIWTGVALPLVFGLCAIGVAVYFGLLASAA